MCCLRQLSYAIKSQLKTPSLCLYRIRELVSATSRSNQSEKSLDGPIIRSEMPGGRGDQPEGQHLWFGDALRQWD